MTSSRLDEAVLVCRETPAGTRTQGFTDDHEVSDEGIRLSVLRRRE
jgi:hypothetical protein